MSFVAYDASLESRYWLTRIQPVYGQEEDVVGIMKSTEVKALAPVADRILVEVSAAVCLLKFSLMAPHECLFVTSHLHFIS